MLTWIDIFSNFDNDIFSFCSLANVVNMKNVTKTLQTILNSWVNYNISILNNRFPLTVLCSCNICSKYKVGCFKNLYLYICEDCKNLLSITCKYNKEHEKYKKVQKSVNSS